MLGMLGLLAAVACMIFLAYRGLGALPLTLLCAGIVALTGGMGIWDAVSRLYMGGYAGVYKSYFLIFVFSAFYAKLMEESGSAAAIGYKLIDWFGSRHVMLVSILIVTALTYGGISLFVVIFAAAPILFLLFEQANLPRHLMLLVLMAGTGTTSMATLPGTPSLPNVVPTQYLGTTMMAAPVLSILCTATLFILCLMYARREERKARTRGEGYVPIPGARPASSGVMERNALPSAWMAFLPMGVLLLIIILGSHWIRDAAMLTVAAMLAASVLTYAFNLKTLGKLSLKHLLNKGLGDGIAAIGGLAAVVAFGAVVSASPAFQSLVQGLKGLNLHPYWKAVLACATVAGVTGSASASLRIVLDNMAGYFLASGVNLGILHRLSVMASATLSSLPHNSAMFLMLGHLGLTHRDAYRHALWVGVIIHSGVVIAATALTRLLGL